MDLRAKIQKLLDEVPELRPDERKVLDFIVTTMPEGPLEDAMYPEVMFQVEGRFQWFFTQTGERRQRKAA